MAWGECYGEYTARGLVQCQPGDAADKPGCCWHKENSCHYGGSNPTQPVESYAVDIKLTSGSLAGTPIFVDAE